MVFPHTAVKQQMNLIYKWIAVHQGKDNQTTFFSSTFGGGSLQKLGIGVALRVKLFLNCLISASWFSRSKEEGCQIPCSNFQEETGRSNCILLLLEQITSDFACRLHFLLPWLVSSLLALSSFCFSTRSSNLKQNPVTFRCPPGVALMLIQKINRLLNARQKKMVKRKYRVKLKVRTKYDVVVK